MRLQQQHSIRARIKLIEQVQQVGHVAQTLRHLFALEVDDEAVVHPMSCELLAKCHGLCAFILVVRKPQVGTTTVQVEPFPQQLQTHHHALAVPSRPTIAPRRRPRRLSGLGELPQCKVGGVAFLLGAEHVAVTTAGKHVVQRLMCQCAIVGHALYGEVHAVTGGVRSTALDECANHGYHLLHVVGCMWNVRRTLHAKTTHRIEPHRLAFVRDVLPRSVLPIGAINDLVVDVRDVGDQSHVDTSPLEIPAQDVVHQRGSTVPQVRRAVDGWTT